MVAPVQKDSLTDYQVALATYLRISSPVAGMFTGNEIKPNPNARSVRIPDIRVDDYIVDADHARIGADHYSGSEFTDEWKNGVPPIFWREYSMSRRRAFGFTVFDEQLKFSPIKNIVQEYTGRKMQTTVLRDHDKYCLLAGIQGHMSGKMVPRVGADLAVNAGACTPGGAAKIANTGNAADYKYIAEPGEDFDNQIQPSFATVTGMALDVDPLKTLDALSLHFSDNWFDSNFGNSERFLLITSALELVFINELIDQGAGTESAFKLLRDGDISGANANGYLGTLKGSWKLVKIHPEFLPKVYMHDTTLVVNPMADETTANHTLRQVVALAAYKNAIQTYEYFSERREQDGGTRFKGTEYVQDFAYDVWAIDQLSEGIVPLVYPATDSQNVYKVVKDSFTDVAARVASARGQVGVLSPASNYPMNPPSTALSRPEWFHQPYNDTTNIDSSVGMITEAGDRAHRHPTLDSDRTALEEALASMADIALAALNSATARSNSASVSLNETFKQNGGLYKVTTAGTTDSSAPADYTTAVVGDSFTDGTAVVKRIA